MAALDFNIARLTPSEHQVQLRRAVIASTIGTAIEWYDFFLYSTVTGSTAIAIYIAICAVITLIATALMTDYSGRDIS